jgi:hypothetical protein
MYFVPVCLLPLASIFISLDFSFAEEHVSIYVCKKKWVMAFPEKAKLA